MESSSMLTFTLISTRHLSAYICYNLSRWLMQDLGTFWRVIPAEAGCSLDSVYSMYNESSWFWICSPSKWVRGPLPIQSPWQIPPSSNRPSPSGSPTLIIPRLLLLLLLIYCVDVSVFDWGRFPGYQFDIFSQLNYQCCFHLPSQRPIHEIWPLPQFVIKISEIIYNNL